MLDPQARAFIDFMIARGAQPANLMTPEQARRAYHERRPYTQPDAPEVAEVRDLSADGVPLRLYRSQPVVPWQPQPVLVYFHGGGWVIGDLETHDVLCRQLALAAGVAVVAVDYRLAPEHAFPAAVDDCVAATRWVQVQADALHLDASRLAVGGDSAGGNLAAVVCLAQREAGLALPAFQLLIYPVTDMRQGAPSYTTNAQGYLLTRESMAHYRRLYTPDETQWGDWRASPLLAADHRGLPPALVLTAGYDPLRDEGRQYADALSAAGVATHYACFERQVHGFAAMPRAIPEADLAIALCGSALRRGLAR
jgi:acetyl esterase